MDLITEGIEKLTLIVGTMYLMEAGGNAVLWRYYPAEAMRVSQAVAEHEMRVAMAMAARAPATTVARAAEQVVGHRVLPEFSRPPGRGYYYIVRSMNKAPAEFQRRAALSDVREIPGYPGKYVVREFGTDKGGLWVDNYLCRNLCDAKGNYDFMLKNGEINPAFEKSIHKMVTDELIPQLEKARLFGDHLRWLFQGPQFRAAFARFVIRNYPSLAEELGTTIQFIDLPGYTSFP